MLPVRCWPSFHDFLTLTYVCRNNLTTPLDCWREVDKFKASVAEVERVSPFPLPPYSPLIPYSPSAIFQNAAVDTTKYITPHSSL